MLSTSVLSFSSSTLVGGVNRIRTEHAIARLQNRNKNISTSTTIRAVGGSSSSAKTKQRYLCQECGEDYSQWYGQCPGCKAWDSMKIFREPISNANASKRGKSGGGAGAAAAQRAQSSSNDDDSTSSSNNDAELKSSSSLIRAVFCENGTITAKEVRSVEDGFRTRTRRARTIIDHRRL